MVLNILSFLLGGCWFLIVLCIPFRVNVSHPIALHASNSGEGLYKSALTAANFGLLGVDFYESFENHKRWRIHSQFVELDRKENRAFMKQVNSFFFAEKTGNEVETKSDYGRSEIDKQQIWLEGNVSIQSKQGFLFTMDRLEYHGKSHEFSTEEKVEMKGPNVLNPILLLKGTGLWSNIDEEHFIIQKGVTAQKRLKSKQWLRIQSKKGEFFTQKQMAHFVGEVTAILPMAVLKSDLLVLDAKEGVESLEAKGAVQLRNRDRVGRAEMAHIQIDSGEMILEGKAKVESRGNEVYGKRIILHSDEDKIEVEDAKGQLK